MAFCILTASPSMISRYSGYKTIKILIRIRLMKVMQMKCTIIDIKYRQATVWNMVPYYNHLTKRNKNAGEWGVNIFTVEATTITTLYTIS